MNREILFRGKRIDNGEWVEGFYMEVQHIEDKSHVHTFILQKDKCLESGGLPGFMVEVNPNTVGRYTGKQISECDETNKRVWEDDLIAVYVISYDDNDVPIRTHIATVQVKWDDNYKILFAECVKGSMSAIAEECDIGGLEGGVDYPFTFWLEYMENSTSRFWEWEIIGNIHDGKDRRHDEF